MTDAVWWKESVVYQIYPRSFNDSDGDGIGDIPGIVEQVDYLDDLGVDVVWLNPVYESPMADNGYDISDYRSIHPDFGTMADWEHLRDELHDRDMRLIMDLVVNHTSDEHEWFERSRREEKGFEEFYHWREGDPDEPPNNWESFFGGSAWSYDDEREAWFLHLFDEKQPDLNWRIPDVRESVYEMMNWWLDQGIDGFRMDVINLISKTEGLPDGDPDDGMTGSEHFVNGPRAEEYIDELYDRVLAGRDVMTVGEMVGVDAETARQYVGESGLSMLIHFEHMGADGGKWALEDLDLPELKAILTDWQETLADEGWNCLYWENHDQPRSVSRFGDDGKYRRESATALATLLFGLRGTPFVYQGQEIGMTNASFEEPSAIRDVEAENYVEEALESGEYEDYEDVRPIVEAGSRDNARTPMQWSDGPHAGFTDGEPWIHVNENYPEINVTAARADGESVWHYYRRLVDLRRERDVFVDGRYELRLADHPDVFAFDRIGDAADLLVAANLSDAASTVELPGVEEGRRVIGNYPARRDRESDEVTFRPYEAAVYER